CHGGPEVSTTRRKCSIRSRRGAPCDHRGLTRVRPRWSGSDPGGRGLTRLLGRGARELRGLTRVRPRSSLSGGAEASASASGCLCLGQSVELPPERVDLVAALGAVHAPAL